MREGVDAGRFARPRRSTDDEVRHVTLFGDDLEPVQRLLVSHHLVKNEERNGSALCSSIVYLVYRHFVCQNVLIDPCSLSIHDVLPC